MRYDLYETDFLTRQQDAERIATRERLANSVRPRLSERIGQALIAAGERLTEERRTTKPRASVNAYTPSHAS